MCCSTPRRARSVSASLTWQIGFSRIVGSSAVVGHIAACLRPPSHKLRAQVADVLSALCILAQRDGHAIVVAALSDLRLGPTERFRFEWLIRSLAPADDEGASFAESEEDEAALWEYRTSAMSLLNALTNSPDDLEERVVLRDELARRGLNEALTVRSSR